jgi:hypothetical protein
MTDFVLVDILPYVGDSQVNRPDQGPAEPVAPGADRPDHRSRARPSTTPPRPTPAAARSTPDPGC